MKKGSRRARKSSAIGRHVKKAERRKDFVLITTHPRAEQALLFLGVSEFHVRAKAFDLQ
jgi:hypothetical protein